MSKKCLIAAGAKALIQGVDLASGPDETRVAHLNPKGITVYAVSIDEPPEPKETPRRPNNHHPRSFRKGR